MIHSFIVKLNELHFLRVTMSKYLLLFQKSVCILCNNKECLCVPLTTILIGSWLNCDISVLWHYNKMLLGIYLLTSLLVCFYFPNDYKLGNFVSRESPAGHHYGRGRGNRGPDIRGQNPRRGVRPGGRGTPARRRSSSGATRRPGASSPGSPPSSLTAPGSAAAPWCPWDTWWPRVTAWRTPGMWTSCWGPPTSTPGARAASWWPHLITTYIPDMIRQPWQMTWPLSSYQLVLM